MAEDHLTLGIEATKKGDLEKAMNYLARAVTENPKSEAGWLWLGRCLTDMEQRKYCYERVLRINPQNTEAQNDLDHLFLANVTESSSSNAGPLSELPISLDNGESNSNWKSNPRFLSIMGVIMGLFICGVPLLFLINSGLSDPLIGLILDKTPVVSPSVSLLGIQRHPQFGIMIHSNLLPRIHQFLWIQIWGRFGT